jgi:hypothetical protein
MEQVTYCILFHMGDWQIFSNGNHYGPHKSAEAAIKIAVAAGKRAKADGQAALVLLQSRDGDLQTIWQWGCEQSFGRFAFA